MPRRHLLVPAADGTLLRDALHALRVRLEVPEEFPAAVLAEARRAADHPRMPELDATDIPLFTIDPPTSTDLDQAMHLARGTGTGTGAPAGVTGCTTPSPTSRPS